MRSRAEKKDKFFVPLPFRFSINFHQFLFPAGIMIAFPNCKINLGLNVLAKMENGFHELETFFYPVNIHDALEILPATILETALTVTGISAGEKENNICLKAYRLLKKDYPQLPEIRIHLHKAIPLGAGLGGGSADGAAMLRLINNKFDLNIAEDKLFGYALMLGSDCPFFLLNKPCLAAGRGEKLTPLPVSLLGYKFLIINPGIHVNTGEAYQEIKPAMPKKRIQEIIMQTIGTWKAELKNDFENSVFDKHPAIKKLKEQLYNEGAVYASMSGSGSTVYGIFENHINPGFLSGTDYFYKIIEAT